MRFKLLTPLVESLLLKEDEFTSPIPGMSDDEFEDRKNFPDDDNKFFDDSVFKVKDDDSLAAIISQVLEYNYGIIVDAKSPFFQTIKDSIKEFGVKYADNEWLSYIRILKKNSWLSNDWAQNSNKNIKALYDEAKLQKDIDIVNDDGNLKSGFQCQSLFTRSRTDFLYTARILSKLQSDDYDIRSIEKEKLAECLKEIFSGTDPKMANANTKILDAGINSKDISEKCIWNAVKKMESSSRFDKSKIKKKNAKSINGEKKDDIVKAIQKVDQDLADSISSGEVTDLSFDEE